MNLLAQAPLWLALLLAACLLAAALQDAARLKISNILCGLILIGGIVAAVVVGPELALWQNMLVFAALLLAGMPLFAAGKLGGGDVKLLATTGLWFDLMGALQMLVAVFLAGGALAVIVLTLRAFSWSEGARQRVRMLRKGAGIPYGVAIAAGALIIMALQRG